MLRILEPTKAEADRLVTIDNNAFPSRRVAWTADNFRTFNGLIIADDAIEQGYIIVQIAADQAEIINVAVTSNNRRRGLGMELLATAQDIAKQNGATEVFLDVADDNLAALALYQKAGYDLAGRRKGYYLRQEGHRVDAQILQKQL